MFWLTFLLQIFSQLCFRLMGFIKIIRLFWLLSALMGYIAVIMFNIMIFPQICYDVRRDLRKQ